MLPKRKALGIPRALKILDKLNFHLFQVLIALYIIQTRKPIAMNGIKNAKNTAASTIIAMKITIPRIHASKGARTGKKVTNKSNTVKIPISVNIHILMLMIK